jgi:TPP-dependent pyruvate/acetoin dehydrogenase alpha subunit
VTKEELIEFENHIAHQFNEGKIRSPVHLYYGNENELIKIFEKVTPQDWVFCSWRSHYQCLLKGVPKKEIEKKILDGLSISLCFSEYNVYSSAIVGGVIPIAVGAAMSIKKKGEDSKVYCFMGDMTSETGIAHESIKFSIQHKLPIKFIIEDNQKSVCTETRDVWNESKITYEDVNNEYIYYYKYETKYPHAGAGVRVQF